MSTIIRKAKESEYEEIKYINDVAFGQPNEGMLVEKLKANPRFIEDLSLVSEKEGKLMGHILFFPIRIKNSEQGFQSLALAPMSVLPQYQRQGIGSLMVQKGLEKAKKLGFKSVIVLGHKDYYPRFGFKPASQWNIQSPFEVADDLFMAVELVPGGLSSVSGRVEYPVEFMEV